MATSPEALAAALGPERELLPAARDLSGEQRFVLWLVATRMTTEAFDLWECANGHPKTVLAWISLAQIRCDRGCGGLRLVARVRRKETPDG